MKNTRRELVQAAKALEAKADSFSVAGDGVTLKNPANARFVSYLNDRAMSLRHEANSLRSYR